MVVENLVAPFWEWLLGTGWHQGALLRAVPLVFFLLATAFVIGGLVLALQRRPGLVGRVIGWTMAVAAASAVLLLLVRLSLWAAGQANLAWADSLLHSAQARWSSALEGLKENLVWLLGPGWREGALYAWLFLAFCLVAAAAVVSWLIAALRNGPVVGSRLAGQIVSAGAADLTRISPRRVWALTWLAVKESIRRRVVVVFAVFILILLFAAWFLDPGSSQPARLYLSFVLTAISYLVLLLALFLSSLSLPADIKNKTLHTVVTKPVRPSEIVLGRMLGFTIIGSGLLVVMGAISYVFVVRGLTHTHELTAADMRRVQQEGSDASSAILQGRTDKVHNHSHNVLSGNDRAEVEMEHGHRHSVTVDRSGDKTAYRLGPPQGWLVARVPLYGKLRFKDPAGQDTDKGVNVGDEWTYRSFIQGGSLATAIWTFNGITEDNFPPDQFPEGLPLEMTIEVFRTTKGDTTDPQKIPLVPGSISVRNPKTGLMAEARIFSVKDFTVDVQYVPRELETLDGEKVDLFRDLTDDGTTEVWLRCLPPTQYFGVAQPDVYFRARDASFPLNLAKGYLGIWLQMVVVIGIGVMCSTFLSGPIAMLATAGVLVVGHFSSFLSELASGKMLGGGPIESSIRLVTQQNMVSEMEPGLRTTVAKMIDRVLETALSVPAAVLPDFGGFSFASYVAYGFAVSPDLVWGSVLRAAAFLLPVFVAAYFFLKTREVAK